MLVTVVIALYLIAACLLAVTVANRFRLAKHNGKEEGAINSNRVITEIIMHCTATTEGVWFDAADIDAWHRERGFKKIGYHYVIRIDGVVEVGRPVGEVGAHCKGHNANSIGICYVGGLNRNGLPEDTRTDAQKRSMHELVRKLWVLYPNATVHGHYEFATKSCPCFNVEREFRPC